MPVEEGWLDLTFGARVEHGSALPQHSSTGNIHQDPFARAGDFYAAYTSKESRHAPELVLTPGLIGVVVALGTIQAAPHENSDFFGHQGRQLKHWVAEMGACRVRTLSRNAFSGYLIVGLILREAASNPLPVAAAYSCIHRHSKNVGEAVGPIVDVALEFRRVSISLSIFGDLYWPRIPARVPAAVSFRSDPGRGGAQTPRHRKARTAGYETFAAWQRRTRQ